MSFFDERFGEWKPVSRIGGISWICAYGLFLLYAVSNRTGFLFLDYVNLMIHEAGHPFFSWGGYTLMILGGTLGELIVPLLCAAYFFWQRETTGFAFCGFWFFENFPYISTYMADARAEALPLIGSGDHDWNILFGHWGMLLQDQKIGGAFKIAGWIGMLLTVAWLGYRTWLNANPSPKLHYLE
jgi:hypothetical protein